MTLFIEYEPPLIFLIVLMPLTNKNVKMFLAFSVFETCVPFSWVFNLKKNITLV